MCVKSFPSDQYQLQLFLSRLFNGKDILPTSKTTLFTVPAASAAYIAPSSSESAHRASILEGSFVGLPELFLDFLDLRAVSERAALRQLAYDTSLTKRYSRSLEEVAGVRRARHCC